MHEPPPRAHRAQLVAYLAENSEWEDDGPWALATFSGHVENRADPDAPWPAINGVVSLDAAVQWARERADKVVVRLAGWDQEFSAGAEPLDGLPPLPEGMELRPRRSAGWEFLDRTPQDEEIDWDVDVGVDTFALVAGADLGLTPAWPRIRSALVDDSRVVAVAPAHLELPISNSNGAWTAGVHTQVATVRVRARTAGEAGTAACAVMAELATATGWEARRGGTPEFTQTGAYPTGSRAAQANAGFRSGRSSG